MQTGQEPSKFCLPILVCEADRSPGASLLSLQFAWDRALAKSQHRQPLLEKWRRRPWPTSPMRTYHLARSQQAGARVLFENFGIADVASQRFNRSVAGLIHHLK